MKNRQLGGNLKEAVNPDLSEAGPQSSEVTTLSHDEGSCVILVTF